MLERAPTGLPQEPLVVREGISFTPFEDLRKLPSPRDFETFVESVDYVACVQISFGALAFNLALTVPEYIDSPDLPRDFETPLGPVDIHHQLSGDEIEQKDREKSITTTLEICSFSTLNSLENFIALSKYALEITMGRNVYYLDCVEQMTVDEAGEIISSGIVQEWGGGPFVSRELKDAEGNEKDAILPYDEGRLNSLGVKIVKKPEII